MSEVDASPQKAVADLESDREALDGWMKRQKPEVEELTAHDVDRPRSTGFSNETVFFSASWTDAGAPQTRQFVARIEPGDSGLFPVQTKACEISVELQHRLGNRRHDALLRDHDQARRSDGAGRDRARGGEDVREQRNDGLARAAARASGSLKSWQEI